MKTRFAMTLAAFSLLSCATPVPTGQPGNVFHFKGYTVQVTRVGCLIESATIKSTGAAVPNFTNFVFMASAKGVTSLSAGLKCQPVAAGGIAACFATEQSPQAPVLSGGLACAKWDSFNLVENDKPSEPWLR